MYLNVSSRVALTKPLYILKLQSKTGCWLLQLLFVLFLVAVVIVVIAAAVAWAHT